VLSRDIGNSAGLTELDLTGRLNPRINQRPNDLWAGWAHHPGTRKVTDSPQLVVSLFSLVAVPDPELMVTLPPQPRS